MPHICPSATCQTPLDPSTNATFGAIEAVLRDLVSVLPDEYVHLGGDEADTRCWSQSQRIAAWMAARWPAVGADDRAARPTHFLYDSY